jgi:hypothetical protein
MDRIMLNSGTEPFSRDDYVTRAFVARQDWRPMSADEWAAMQATDPQSDPTESIYLWKIPKDIDRYFDGFRRSIAKYNDESLITNLAGHPDYLRGRQKMADLIKRCGGGGELRVLGHYSRPPGLISCSIRRDGLFVGLHLDSWFSKPLDARTDGLPNRLCINLGPETRYFNVMNLSVRAMLQDKRVKAVPDPIDFVADYLEANPNYPVLRLAVQPGEAYIAPQRSSYTMRPPSENRWWMPHSRCSAIFRPT